MSKTIAFTGALFDGQSINEPYGAVVLQDQSILWSGPVVNCPFKLTNAIAVPRILPGLLDVHHHGGAGKGYKDDTEAARIAAQHHHKQGSTTLIGSVVSATNEQMLANITALKPLVEDGTLDGIHLEGPFISLAKKGAHDPTVIADGNPEWFKAWCEAGEGAVKSITLAMETPNFDELITICRTHNVMPSLGHSDATAKQTEYALGADIRSNRPDNGPWTVTHLFNAMNSIHHRQPGPIPVFLHHAKQQIGDLTVELIPDGTHVTEEIARMVFDTVGEQDGVIMITDAMDAAGLGDGEYVLGTLDVVVTDGVARLRTEDGSQGSIAGGTSHMFDNLKRLIIDYKLNPAHVVRAATGTPAARYGFTDRGQLTAGCRGDLLLLDDHMNRLGVYRAGKELS